MIDSESANPIMMVVHRFTTRERCGVYTRSDLTHPHRKLVYIEIPYEQTTYQKRAKIHK